ncbi:hypothetical protein A6E11_03775 [Aliivibrio fischeri]|nr:hypothetical protein A6E11_03775 [Aliivibrio fischeri]
MIFIKIIKLMWIHTLSYDQMVLQKINNQTTRCANSIFYMTLFINSMPIVLVDWSDIREQYCERQWHSVTLYEKAFSL